VTGVFIEIRWRWKLLKDYEKLINLMTGKFGCCRKMSFKDVFLVDLIFILSFYQLMEHFCLAFKSLKYLIKKTSFERTSQSELVYAYLMQFDGIWYENLTANWSLNLVKRFENHLGNFKLEKNCEKLLFFKLIVWKFRQKYKKKSKSCFVFLKTQ
jgi:hypothetical protein